MEAIVNLIRNGLESRPSGACVWLRARRVGQALELVVEDDGPGIEADDARRIFEPFFTTKASDGGSGLGLTMVARAIEGLGGTIELVARSPRDPHEADVERPMDGGGARFVIRLPLAPDES